VTPSAVGDPDAVIVVGAGIAGAACAVALREGGIAVQVLDRGRAPGGRMASPLLHGRRVDTGAAYFTVRDDGFAAVVKRWATAGLAREWTDTFRVLGPGETPASSSGPLRWAAPDGLRSLVRAMLDGVEVTGATAIDAIPAGDVVLAMPDPQASRLVAVPEPVAYDPVIAVVCGYAERCWGFADAAFVQDHPAVAFVADDGARRGDGAPVLVAHTTADLAGRHLDDPEGAVGATVAALSGLLDVGAPVWTHAQRWTFAKPSGHHGATFGIARLDDGRPVGLAGDQWCPHGSPRVESAWRSGTDLGNAIVAARR
jgi:renalase